MTKSNQINLKDSIVIKLARELAADDVKRGTRRHQNITATIYEALLAEQQRRAANATNEEATK